MIVEYNVFDKLKDKMKDSKIKKLTKRLSNLVDSYIKDKRFAFTGDVNKNYYYKKLKNISNSIKEPIYVPSFFLERIMTTNDAHFFELILPKISFDVTYNHLYFARDLDNTEIMNILLDNVSKSELSRAINDYYSSNIFNSSVRMIQNLLRNDKVLKKIKLDGLENTATTLLGDNQIEKYELLKPYIQDYSANNNLLLSTSISNDNFEIFKDIIKHEEVLKSDLNYPISLSIRKERNDMFDILIDKVKASTDYIKYKYFIFESISAKNFYALDKLIKLIDWNSFGKSRIEIDILKELSEYLLDVIKYDDKYPIKDLFLTVSKNPIFINKLDSNVKNYIIPNYNPKKIIKKYE